MKMNKRQKEVQQAYLDNEKAVLNKIKECYRNALDDINQKIELLLARQDADMQRVIYQVEYQEALRKQVSAILDTLQTEEFEKVSEYLTKSYEEGFLGTMYDLHGQGIPLVFPIDQQQVLDAVQHDTKLSVSLYSKMGKDIHTLKKQISSEISRGIAGAAMYAEIARNISSYADIPMNNAMRIARTEANRIQNRATLDAQFKAKEKGANVVKQWSAALDDRTRESHRELDGQIRELEEEFEVNGHKAMYPGGFGIASEDINCRCCINQRARWNLQSEEYKYSKAAGEVVSIKSDVYREWKNLYNKYVDFLILNVEGKTPLDNAANYIKVMQAISKLPQHSQLAMLDVQYEFGGSRCYCKIAERTIRYADDVTEQEIYHEMGHLLEGDMFPADEVLALKQKYFQDVSIYDVHTEEYKYFDGKTKKEIVLVANDRLLDPYQGRIYVEYEDETIDDKGNLRVDEMLEFISVPISYYLTEPEKLLKMDPEMYEFIRRYLK